MMTMAERREEEVEEEGGDLRLELSVLWTQIGGRLCKEMGHLECYLEEASFNPKGNGEPPEALGEGTRKQTVVENECGSIYRPRAIGVQMVWTRETAGNDRAGLGGWGRGLWV